MLGLSDTCSNIQLCNDSCDQLLPEIYSGKIVSHSLYVGKDTSSIFSESTKLRATPFSLSQDASCDKLGQSIESMHEIEWKNIDSKSTQKTSKSLQATSISNPVKSSSDIAMESSKFQTHEIEPIISSQGTAFAEVRANTWQAELEWAVMLLDAFCIVDRGFLPEDD
jgi:hypothetical protein